MAIIPPSQESCTLAAKTLLDGGVVSFPTETVYGLGCDTFNESAINEVYALKNRPKNNPMIAHVLDVSWVNQLCTRWSDECNQLVEAFWPGPLAIVVPRKEPVPKTACGGFDTIAIRSPSHPVARMLLATFDNPISAPSANKSGHISPTTAQHVVDEFGESITILDGGSCERGIESTVISMTSAPTILRLGSVTPEEIQNIIGEVHTKPMSSQSNSPGTSTRHYAPITKVMLLEGKHICEVNDPDCIVITMHANPVAARCNFQMPKNAQEYARKLYLILREADAIGANLICIEKPPNSQKWQAINDRLQRCGSD